MLDNAEAVFDKANGKFEGKSNNSARTLANDWAADRRARSF
jgi:hypothetical protein